MSNFELENDLINMKQLEFLQSKSNSVVVIPEKRYEYPKGHACHGCLYTFETSRPSCILAGVAGNCSFQKFLDKQNQYSSQHINRSRLHEKMDKDNDLIKPK